MRVIVAALAIYAVYLPIAWYVHHDYITPPRPIGDHVELLLRFDLDKPDKYYARSYAFSVSRFPDTSKLAVYENDVPMPEANTWFTADGSAYVVRVKPTDGSDPRTNARNYWLVLRARSLQ